MKKRCWFRSVAAYMTAGVPLMMVAVPSAHTETVYYTEPQVFQSRPHPDREMDVGCIGATGLKARIHKGVAVTVEGTLPGSPAEGKFTAGQVITGVNGKALKGRNPFVALGNALTEAEARDGRLVFEILPQEGAAPEKVSIQIPVLGSYAETWPLQCDKSRKIIEQAAHFYAFDETFGKTYFKARGMEGALACLFLLSTGDDQYLPRVKAYFDQFLPNVQAIGDHTWNNGYNGIACAEYYLRTGDKAVLPILQYYCDNARDRQKFGCSWTHWGRGISPGYVAGGLMNPAGAQVLTTLLMARECGVDVDEKTLLGALRFWYRFAGHGTVPYGDHRPEGGLGSNGKDGMSAAAMQIASGARGDVTIYKKARDYLGMSMLSSYPVLVRGHGDEGRGDGIWRGLTSAYLLDDHPETYHEAMRRLQWWYDLSRRPSGALGIATCQRFNDVGSGAGLALSYTAPLKTLRLTGAPRSKHAQEFELPEHLWGRPADLAFLSIENGAPYGRYGSSDPIHIPYYAYGSAYAKPALDLQSAPRKDMLKNVYHARYMIRAQAAKALHVAGDLEALERLLKDPDPRVRRAALDGLVDYNYWFGTGRSPVRTEAFTPGMLTTIRKMLSDPAEALWVVDGALMALQFAPAEDIDQARALILPWTQHEDWWLRESAFMALMGMEKDKALFAKVVPVLMTMLAEEYHTAPRERCSGRLTRVLRNEEPDSPVGRMILAGFLRAAKESEIKPGERSAEGAYNVARAAEVCLKQEPETALEIAETLHRRFGQLGTEQIVRLAATPNANRENKPYGLYSALKDLPADQAAALTDLLYNTYRPELVRRLKQAEGDTQPLIDTILDLAKLKNPVAGWTPLGKAAPADRVWRYTAVHPQPKDVMHPREKKRFRDIELPKELAGWTQPAFDDSAWKRGRAPIGTGSFQRGGTSFTNRSEWGEGEFILMRSTFEMGEPDYDAYRISVLAKQGFHIYLNGHKIHTYIWWKDMPHYRPIMLGDREARHLKKGTNVLAVYSNVDYLKDQTTGQIDVFLEGLKNSDLQ